MFKKILVPLDGSELAEQALIPAHTLASVYNAVLFLLYTCRVGLADDISQDVVNDYDWFWLQLSEEPSQTEDIEYMDQLVRRLVRDNINIQSLLVKGDEAGAIIGIAEAQDIDLIVMTKHCRESHHRDVLGDVTERVLHHAPCSVLVICSNPRRGHYTAYPSERRAEDTSTTNSRIY